MGTIVFSIFIKMQKFITEKLTVQKFKRPKFVKEIHRDFEKRKKAIKDLKFH